MVKSYLKYEHAKSFGLITSATANLIWVPEESPKAVGRLTCAGSAVTAAEEDILCWDIKKGELISRWRDDKCNAQVTAIARSKTDPDIYAAGYGDGSIRLWDSRLGTIVISFNGHKSAVTSLAFDRSGVRLASGSQDTDIILWDLIAETGLFKLRGHKNQITGLCFLDPSRGQDLQQATDEISGNSDNNEIDHTEVLLSSGKDALIKLWDVETQYCIETHIAQSNGECWSLAVSPNHAACVTGGNDGEFRIWSIDLRQLKTSYSSDDQESKQKCLLERGSLSRQGKDRTIGVTFHAKSNYILMHGAEKSVEIWRIRTAVEIQKALGRERKRRREKARAKGDDSMVVDGDDQEDSDLANVDITKMIELFALVRTTGKVRAVDWTNTKSNKALQILVSTTNNQLEVYDIPIYDKENYERTFAVDLPGHRTDIRSTSLSSDDRMLASASNGHLKVWNIKTQTCIRTLECGYALCCSFLPGDKIVAVGNRSGELELFDIASSTTLEIVQAHEGAVWTLHVHPDGKSIVTGGADKCAKFWTFEIVQEEVPGSRRTTSKLKLVHKRTLKVSDDILSVKYSPDARLLAVALLDNTVKVFFVDSLKLFLNLYGHKLPVLSMDISFDSKLIVTSSADKNVRLWGLDFGDCHKAFFAHEDSIMQVAFVPHNQDGNGHHFFSASKDRTIKYWDGDKFERIQVLNGHHGEIWAIVPSRTGEFLISASHDKTIRLWEQTDEQIFLEEEKEKDLEELYEKTLNTSLDQDDEAEEGRGEVVAAGKQTSETLMAGERIVEALEIGLEDLTVVSEWENRSAQQPNIAPPQRNLTFMAFGNISAERHVLNVVERIKAAALQDALLVLTFNQMASLLTFVSIWTEKAWNLPLTCRILFFMLKTHHRQIMASKTMRPMLDDIRQKLRKALKNQKDEMGFNLAALRYVGAQVQDKTSKGYVDEATWDEQIRKSQKKRAFLNVT